MKTDLSQSCNHCWVFHICWHIECSTLASLAAASFMIWSSSTGIPSLPPALFVVMLPKPHLTSHYRMPGCSWVTTPSGLSNSLRLFFFLFSFLWFFLYPCHHFLISHASVRSLLHLSFIATIIAWNVPLASSFLEETSSLSIWLFSSIFLHWSLKKAFSLSVILWFSTVQT